MRRGWLWLFVAAILLTLLFFYKLAATDLILARGDTFAYFYPYWEARDAALAQNALPLWSPELFMGLPLLADSQLGTFYPPNWLTVSLSTPDAIKISIVLHVAWALLGAGMLARRVLRLSLLPALTAGIVFAFGGYLSAHVEQINQLQGLAWMPWLFLLFDRLVEKPVRILPLMALAWGMQILSGHTQTVFITGVGLGVVALLLPLFATQKRALDGEPTLRVAGRYAVPLLWLALAAVLGLVVASPQIIPTQELVSLSNRGGGLTVQEATAFSLTPFLAGRGLLPSYDAQPFGEYVGYIGLAGLGLVMFGTFSTERRRWVWVILLLTGVLLAFGRHNPLYLLLANLPGFNLFRVPARWLALAALGAALLAGLGMQALLDGRVNGRQGRWRMALLTFGAVALLLMASTLLSSRAADEVDGSALPTLSTLSGWGVALLAFGLVLWRGGRYRAVLAGLLVVAELWLAAQYLPYNDVTDPAVYRDPRFAASLMQVYQAEAAAPGRLLSISNLLFDPGDRAALEARWAQMPLTDRAARYAFTATKMQETLAANLPLTWGIASVDGFGGGLLPTAHYTAFTSLLLPEGTLRTIDGRLREVLAKPECRGACIPSQRWLDLTHTRYLLTDKVYDVVAEGVFYDTQLRAALNADETLILESITSFESNVLHLLLTCASAPCDAPGAMLTHANGENIVLEAGAADAFPSMDGMTLIRYPFTVTTPQALTLTANDAATVHALTLVDDRTGDFVQLTPPGWTRLYSADVKIYENQTVLPRAFLVYEARTFPDDWQGTEDALAAMRDPAFDPARRVVLNTNTSPLPLEAAEALPDAGAVTITDYTPTRIVMEVEAAAPGYLVLTDAYYPGWRVMGEEALPVYRANVMFRAVPVDAGTHTLVMTYDDAFWLPFVEGVFTLRWVVVVFVLLLLPVFLKDS
ncbi:MAG: hypothetical protein OHK0046_35580 [Anaerolineae bacterium]